MSFNESHVENDAPIWVGDVGYAVTVIRSGEPTEQRHSLGDVVSMSRLRNSILAA